MDYGEKLAGDDFEMAIGAIIQARVSSERLPKKVLKELPYGSGITVLEQVIDRVKRVKNIDKIILATTVKKIDKRIVIVAKKKKIIYFQGSEKNVLERYYLAAKKNNLDIIVRVTSDCPCFDPLIADYAIKRHLEENADYTSNTLERTYPRGLDVEVFNFEALKKNYKNAKKDFEKEHVTPYLYRNPSLFKIVQIEAPKKLYAPNIRITLDTTEDYLLLCMIFNYLYKSNRFFDAPAIINLFKKKPWLRSINNNVHQKTLTE